MEDRDSQTRCLNCGSLVESNFCPDCGQPATTARFTMRSLMLHVAGSVSRVSVNFFRTAWGLLAHPWAVVRDYVYGRRVGLVSPVTMLLLLALYWGIAMAAIPELHKGVSEATESLRMGSVLKWLYGSLTFQYLFLSIPIALGTWIVYREDMRGRFNFAELTIATLYLACTFLLVDFILVPVEYYNSALSYIIVAVVTTGYGFVSIIKAFPQHSRLRMIVKLCLWLAVCGTLLMLSLMLFAIPMFYSFSAEFADFAQH